MGIKKDREEFYIRETRRVDQIIAILFVLGLVLTFKPIVMAALVTVKNYLVNLVG